MGNDHSTVIERLAEIFPQLYLDPDKADIEEYKACVRKGKDLRNAAFHIS